MTATVRNLKTGAGLGRNHDHSSAGSRALPEASGSAESKAPDCPLPIGRGLPSTDILGVHVHAVDMTAAVDAIESAIAADLREYVALCNVHMIMEADDAPAFRDVLAGAALRLPDGMPLVWLSRRAGNHTVDRVRGADLVDALCARSGETGHRHYFYGGGTGIAQEMAQRLEQRHPGLHIAGASTPGKLAVGQQEDPAVIDTINCAQPDILWVGIGQGLFKKRVA